MDNQRILDLIEKFELGEATAQEIQELDKWYQSFSQDEKYATNLKEDQKILFKQSLFDSIEQELDKEIMAGKIRPKRDFNWLAAAAVFLLFTTGGYFYYFHFKTPTTQIANNKKPDALPGGNKAVLTLANGQKIILESAKKGNIATQGNATVVKLDSGKLAYNINGQSKEIALNTMSTQAGGQYQLTLSDGTKVWLNAESSITYPSTFTGTTRNVATTGEVYFEVAKNAAMPFHVKSGNQDIEVLGTHFNVNAYPDETAIKTTLLEGSVKVSQLTTNRSQVIKPGQQAALQNNQFNVYEVNTEPIVAWKEGLFRFDHTDIHALMRQFSRWYNVEIVYEGDVKSEPFFGKIERDYTLAQVLKVLELSKTHFRIENPVNSGGQKRLIVMP